MKIKMISVKLITFVYWMLYGTSAVSDVIIYPIGGLFNNLGQSSSLQVFKNIVRLSGNRTYEGRCLHSRVFDSYSTAMELCSFTSDNRGIIALIDARPTNGICDTVCLLANRYNISHLSVGWEPRDSTENNAFTFSYHPPLEILSKAYTTLIQNLQWDEFTILYEDEGCFIRLQDILNTWPINTQLQDPITFRKLDPNGDNREIFKDIFNVEKINYHILDCKLENTYKYFREMVEINNNTEFQSFILTNLDAYQLQLDEIPELMANVSTFRLTTPIDDKWIDIEMVSDKNNIIQLETALTVDAINHIDKVILNLQEEQYTAEQPPALCYQDKREDYEPWNLGSTVREKLMKITTQGFTGNVQFDEYGRRENFDLFYMKLDYQSQFVFAGTWNSNLNTIIHDIDVPDRSLFSSIDSKLMIVTKQGIPYFDMNSTSNGMKYRGYAVDLIDKIFEVIKKENGIDFKYEFYDIDCVGAGNPIPGTKKWDGIIGELMEHKASLGVCDITITSERLEVVDFSIPFMSLGIGLLMKEKEPDPPKMFSFIEPLALDVWLYLATTFIIVSFILLICARMSKADWVNPHPCNQHPENFQNIWSFNNCMWLMMGTIMMQGCDILPRAPGSRWIAGMWWFFALIVTSSYTANLATFLSESRRVNEIKDVKALADQLKITYGLHRDGSTHYFFEHSNDTLYQKLYASMKDARPSVFTSSNAEGVERVDKSNGKYAFFMESTAIEYSTKRNCKLKMVGSKLDSKEYGIAMPKNFPHKRLIDSAILSLQEKGDLHSLKKKWWEDEDNKEHCANKEKDEDNNGLQMQNTSGIFIVLGLGGILGFIVSIIAFLMHAQEISVKERITFREAFMSEWRASFNPKALHKPAAPPRSAAPSTTSPTPERERSRSRAVSVLEAATSFINLDEVY